MIFDIIEHKVESSCTKYVAYSLLTKNVFKCSKIKDDDFFDDDVEDDDDCITLETSKDAE